LDQRGRGRTNCGEFPQDQGGGHSALLDRGRQTHDLIELLLHQLDVERATDQRGEIRPLARLAGDVNQLVRKIGNPGREFKPHAHELSPILSVVTNLDREHMDCYRNMRDVKKTFLEFMDRVPFYGMVVVCNDDPMLRRLLPQAQRRTVTYGTKRGSDFLIKLEANDAAAGARHHEDLVQRRAAGHQRG